MVNVIVMVKDGVRSETFGLELPDLGPEELAMVEELSHELIERVQRIAKIRAAKARRVDGEGK